MGTIPTLRDCNLGLRRSPITTLKKKRAVHWWTEVMSRLCRVSVELCSKNGNAEQRRIKLDVDR
jgi:hypothetical protein